MTRLSRTFFAALLAATVLASPVPAQDMTDADKEAIATRVASFNEVIRSGNMGGAFDYMPPKLLTHLATQFAMPEADLKTAMVEQMNTAFETVTIESFGMDVEKASYATTADGSRRYALIPTETVMAVEGAGKMQSKTHTLAVEDEGQWYLLRIDDAQQVAMIQAVYPEFAGVAFPTGTMAAVE